MANAEEWMKLQVEERVQKEYLKIKELMDNYEIQLKKEMQVQVDTINYHTLDHERRISTLEGKSR